MIVTFGKDYLRELYETGKADKKHRFQPDIISATEKALTSSKAQTRLKTCSYFHPCITRS